jgi:hypothetical protein
MINSIAMCVSGIGVYVTTSLFCIVFNPGERTPYSRKGARRENHGAHQKK